MIDSAAGNQLYKLVINDAVCRACRRCLAGDACRGNAFIRLEAGESPFIDMSRCWGCLICLAACPFEAVVREGYGSSSGNGSQGSGG